MKLRCTENSIRVRLRRSELEVLKVASQIEEQVGFPNGQKFIYRIKIGGKALMANFEGQTVSFHIPKEQAEKWINSDQVGVETQLALDGDKTLHLLLEKDFPCKDRPEEDKSDLFQDLAQSNSNC